MTLIIHGIAVASATIVIVAGIRYTGSTTESGPHRRLPT